MAVHLLPVHLVAPPPSTSSSPRQRQQPIVSGALRARSRFWFAGALVAEVAEPAEVGGGAAGEEKTTWKGKGSSQLTRWARARRARSGRPAELRDALHVKGGVEPRRDGSGPTIADKRGDDERDAEDGTGYLSGIEEKEKVIYLVSDGTGWTAEESVHAALGQFEYCLVDKGCPVNTHLFSEVNEVDRLMEIIRHAGEEGAILLYTLADPAIAEAAKNFCQYMGIPYVDILGPITEAIGAHLGFTPSGLPRGAPGRKTALSKQYFKRIEAVDFTIKQDDGAFPKNLQKADIVLVGVSRTSKTPLSTYMAQKGYKVANVPLVLGVDPPKELFDIDQSKIYALTINPNYLQSIRLSRYRSLGVTSTTSYSDMDCIKMELDYSSNLFLQNPRWPVIGETVTY